MSSTRAVCFLVGVTLGALIGFLTFFALPYQSDAEGCTAAGGSWQLAAASCDYGGAR